jgi:hypothetical protein
MDDFLKNDLGVGSLAGFAAHWEERDDRDDPTAVSWRVRLFMLPYWSVVASLAATFILLQRRYKKQGPLGFEVAGRSVTG